MNDFQVQYQGFHPSEFTKSYLTSVLYEIQERAPFGSRLRAVFIRRGHELNAYVRIQSAAGQFFARSRGTRIRSVARKTFAQINKQLSRWKTSRHGGQNHGLKFA